MKLNGDSANDWYDLWKEGNFEEAAKSDTLMFVVTRE